MAAAAAAAAMRPRLKPQHAQPPDSPSWLRLRPGVIEFDFEPFVSSVCVSRLIRQRTEDRSLGHMGRIMVGTHSSLMVLAINVNASSTFVEFLAEVSMKGIDRLSANSCATRVSGGS